VLEKLAPVQFGPRAYVPMNRDRNLLGEDGEHPCSCGTEWDAWSFRSGPFEIKSAWSPTPGCMYDDDDLRRARMEFRPLYRDRLRLLLAEAVPGAGAL
jgi:hypothetical protein